MLSVLLLWGAHHHVSVLCLLVCGFFRDSMKKRFPAGSLCFRPVFPMKYERVVVRSLSNGTLEAEHVQVGRSGRG